MNKSSHMLHGINAAVFDAWLGGARDQLHALCVGQTIEERKKCESISFAVYSLTLQLKILRFQGINPIISAYMR